MATNKGINIPVTADTAGFINQMGRAADALGSLGKKAREPKSEIDRLNTSLKQTEKDLKNLALSHGKDSEAFKAASLQYQDIQNKIKGVNEALVSVGAAPAQLGQKMQTAAGGFNMLGNSVNQLTRELPAFTYSVQTGFMALSNNIPMFVDQINSIRQNNAALIAQGQPVKSTFSQIAGAIFSWQTGISLAITASTIFADKIVSLTEDLFVNNEAIAESQKNIDRLTISFVNADKALATWIDTYGQTLSGRQAEEFKAREEKEKRFQELLRQSMAIQAEEQKTGEKNLVGRNSIYFALQESVNLYNKQLAEIEQKYKAIGKQVEIQISAAQLANKIGAFKPNVSEADINTIPEGLNEAASAADNYSAAIGVAAVRHQEFLDKLVKNAEIMQMANQIIMSSFVNLGNAIGDAFATGDLGKNMLGFLAQFMATVGSAAIAVGVAYKAMGFTFAQGAASIAAGIALIAASRVVAAKGRGGGTSVSNSAASGGSYTGNFSPNISQGSLFVLDSTVRGQDLIIATRNTDRNNSRVRPRR